MWTEQRIFVSGRVSGMKAAFRTGPIRVYPMRIGKTPQYFQFCLRKYADWWPSDLSGRTFITGLSQRLHAHRVNGINSWPWYQDQGTQSGRVFQAGLCAPITWRVWIGGLFHPYFWSTDFWVESRRKFIPNCDCTSPLNPLVVVLPLIIIIANEHGKVWYFHDVIIPWTCIDHSIKIGLIKVKTTVVAVKHSYQRNAHLSLLAKSFPDAPYS